MRSISRLLIFLALAAALFLPACGAPPPTATATPDPCAPENIGAEAQKVHALMREFDDASQLASVAPLSQMATVIPPLQDIRRRAEDLQVPPCLATLKAYQLQHMNAVINTLLAFMQTGSNNPDALAQGILQARTFHEQYNQELARLIGATYVPPAPTATSAPATVPPAVSVKNDGTVPVNIRAKPYETSDSLGTLDPGASIPAVGKTADGLWIQVMDQAGNTAWIYASLVTLVNGDTLPVVTPVP
jgi:hypothetical protein